MLTLKRLKTYYCYTVLENCRMVRFGTLRLKNVEPKAEDVRAVKAYSLGEALGKYKRVVSLCSLIPITFREYVDSTHVCKN